MSNLCKRVTLSVFTALACLTLWAGHASAQEDGSKRVVILKFDTLDVEEEMMDVFYAELNARIEAHEDKTIVEGGEVSINDMLLTVGCDEGPTPECLTQLGDFVDADQLLFGSVQSADDVHLFTVRLFDFATESFEAEIEEQTVDGDIERVRDVIPALIDNLLYGNVGKLSIKISGKESYDIFLDGEMIGKSSTDIEDLPLGEHIVMVRSTSGEEQTQQVVLTKDDVTSLTFDFAGGEPPPTDSATNKLLLPGVGLAAVGLVAAGFGTAQYLGYRRDANRLNELAVCTSSPGASAQGCDAFAVRDEDREEVLSLGEYERQRTRAIIGWSAGSVLTALGATLVYLGGRQESSQSALKRASDKHVKIQWRSAKGYQGVQVQGRF